MGYSGISQELFDDISNIIGKKKCQYATNKGELRLEKNILRDFGSMTLNMKIK